MTRAGEGEEVLLWLFLSGVRMMEKAARSLEKRQKGEAHHSGLGDNFHSSCYLFLLLGKEKLGEENGLALMKLCPEPLAGTLAPSP